MTVQWTGECCTPGLHSITVDCLRNKPFQFSLGVGQVRGLAAITARTHLLPQVIAGWDEGLLGMCVGERRTLVIPPRYTH